MELLRSASFLGGVATPFEMGSKWGSTWLNLPGLVQNMGFDLRDLTIKNLVIWEGVCLTSVEMVCMSLHTIMGSTTNLFFNDLSTTNGKENQEGYEKYLRLSKKRLEDPIFRQALGPSLC